jgi:drug/metabolite transporter (DMT)-like permease
VDASREVPMGLLGLLTRLLSPRSWGVFDRARLGGLPLSLIGLNQLVNVGAYTCFALSGRAVTTWSFIGWQALGSLFGLGTQLTFAGMVRYGTVRMASAVGIGLAFVSAEIFSAYFIFREAFTRTQWLGVGCVFLGLLLLAFGRR